MSRVSLRRLLCISAVTLFWSRMTRPSRTNPWLSVYFAYQISALARACSPRAPRAERHWGQETFVAWLVRRGVYYLDRVRLLSAVGEEGPEHRRATLPASCLLSNGLINAVTLDRGSTLIIRHPRDSYRGISVSMHPCVQVATRRRNRTMQPGSSFSDCTPEKPRGSLGYARIQLANGDSTHRAYRNLINVI